MARRAEVAAFFEVEVEGDERLEEEEETTIMRRSSDKGVCGLIKESV